MKVIYTTCTYNHLARAFSLAESVELYCPDTKFIICLIGDGILNDEAGDKYSIIRSSELNIAFLKEMYLKYSTLELNAALKPYFASYIFNVYKETESILFFDSDILLFHSLDIIYEKLSDYSIILTPHALSSIKSGYGFDDRNFLSSGIYNIGFYAIKKDANAFAFLDWWMDKLRDECFIDIKNGMFAEQLCLNLVPIYFQGGHVLRHIGCNVAYWNLHERVIDRSSSGYLINQEEPLIFYHFSGASINCIDEDNLSKHQNRYTFTNRPDVLPVFQKYVSNLKCYGYEKYKDYYNINSHYKTKSKTLIFIVEAYKKVLKRIFFN